MVRKIIPPASFDIFMKDIMRKHHKKRKSDAVTFKELKENNLIDPREFYRSVAENENVTATFDRAVEISKKYKGRMPGGLFLVGMRCALVHTMMSVASSPSGLYTLQLQSLYEPHQGSWADDNPIVIKNEEHKTSEKHGYLR